MSLHDQMRLNYPGIFFELLKRGDIKLPLVKELSF